MKLSALLEPMIAAGVPGDVLLATVRAFEEQYEGAAEKSKEKARARWHKWKQNQPTTNVGKRLPTTANVSNPLVRGEDNNLPTEITGQEEKKAARAGLSDFKSGLSVLDEERLEAFVAHRRAKKAALTGYGAKLFLQDCAACDMTPAQGVDMAISRGWITVKPEYLAGRQNRSTAPPSPDRPPRNAGEAARLELKRLENEDAPSPQIGYDDQSDAGPGFAGTGIARRIALAASR